MKWWFAILGIVVVAGFYQPVKACIPDCTDKECGDDGCGGSCGECAKGEQCVVGHCVKGCGGLVLPGSDEGSCCYKGKMIYCSHGRWVVNDCGSDENCRWESVGGGYFCDPDLPDYEDPTHRQPRECNFKCVPYCKDKECGDDGCGGSCGSCDPGDKCIDGHCCHPNCEGKDCGSDGCGGSCGHCHEWEVCNESGRCERNWGCYMKFSPGCPDCACEEEVCKKAPECCTWAWDEYCAQMCKWTGKCGPCKPDCTNKECGDDGCGGSCGRCPHGKVCIVGKCMPCHPDCKDKECGDDGCGGSCGECAKGYVCKEGKCKPCQPGCGEDDNCGYDECGNSCTPPWEPPCTGPGVTCRYNRCIACESYCINRECGDDGCGGSCGKCKKGEECISHHCKPVSDTELSDNEVEPMPDTGQIDTSDVNDVYEVIDTGLDNTSKEVDIKEVKEIVEIIQKDRLVDSSDSVESSKDMKKTKDAKKGEDIKRPVPADRPSSSGCTTGSGGRSSWLLLFAVVLGILRLWGYRSKKSFPNIRHSQSGWN